MSITGAEYATWGLAVMFATLGLLALVIADHAVVGRRLRQAGHLLAEAGPWLVSAALHPWAMRGRTLSPAARIAATPSHPSVRPPGLPVDGRPLDAYEQERLDAIRRNFSWAPEPQYPVQGREAS